MFRQGQLAVHGLAILLGRNEAGISNRGKSFLHHAVLSSYINFQLWESMHMLRKQTLIKQTMSNCPTQSIPR